MIRLRLEAIEELSLIAVDDSTAPLPDAPEVTATDEKLLSDTRLFSLADLVFLVRLKIRKINFRKYYQKGVITFQSFLKFEKSCI